MFNKARPIAYWQAPLLFIIVGLIIFSKGINSPFQGDDIPQIVNNGHVHSLSHLGTLFTEGTFDTGQPRLAGIYYRPLMMVAYTIIYHFFGTNTAPYHLLQLAIWIAASYIVYLFFKLSFNQYLSLGLALIFLVHPLNSQIVFAIPSLQDALFFFFGISGLYVLVRYRSGAVLLSAALLFLLSLLAKESAVLFIALAMAYLWVWDRSRELKFILAMALPVAAYIFLKIHAIGLAPHAINAPIDMLNVAQRLETAASLPYLFFKLLLFPVSLASAYFFTYQSPHHNQFILSCIVDILILLGILGAGSLIRKHASKAQFYTFSFFALAILLDFALHSQIIPLDMTFCETWFPLAVFGVLGCLGVLIENKCFLASCPKSISRIIGACLILIIILLSGRTLFRGEEWASPPRLWKADVATQAYAYTSYNDLATYYLDKSNLSLAEKYAHESITIYPYIVNYNTLGQIYTAEQRYKEAINALRTGARMGYYFPVEYNLEVVLAFHGDLTTANEDFYLSLTEKDPALQPWLFLAILRYNHGDLMGAREAISNAYTLYAGDSRVALIYSQIMKGVPLNSVIN